MRVLSLVVTGLLVTASAAHAAPLELSNFTGAWDPLSVLTGNAATAGTVNYADAGGSSLDAVNWGTGTANNPGLQSGYTFDLRESPFSPVLETPFALGDFQHINNEITLATSLFTGINYDFSFNTNGVPSQLNEVLSFTHNETPNAGPCSVGVVPCPDLVSVTYVELLSQEINVGGLIYIFSILGFSPTGTEGTFSNMFVSPEFGTNSSTLWAVVSGGEPDVPEVPEPASLVLLGGGLVLVARQVRRRRAANRNV